MGKLQQSHEITKADRRTREKIEQQDEPYARKMSFDVASPISYQSKAVDPASVEDCRGHMTTDMLRIQPKLSAVERATVHLLLTLVRKLCIASELIVNPFLVYKNGNVPASHSHITV
jgi:hypothetical protein